MVEMHIEQEEICECINCAKEFDSIVKFSAYLVLWFKGVIGGEFLSVSACCEICHQKLLELPELVTNFFTLQDMSSNLYCVIKIL